MLSPHQLDEEWGLWIWKEVLGLWRQDLNTNKLRNVHVPPTRGGGPGPARATGEQPGASVGVSTSPSPVHGPG